MKKTIYLSLFAIIGLISCKDDNTPETNIKNIKTFSNVKVAFADGMSQSVEGTYTFPTDMENIKSVKMYLQDICPNKECDEWDRFANIYAKDKKTGEWYEIGRFITPYWVGTEKLQRGLEFDVTDFKSILNGSTELKIYTETWLAKGRVYSLEFDFEYGTPDYKYSSVVPVFQYNKSSIDGVPYGIAVDTDKFDLTKTINIPTNAEIGYFRTTISGWGHATVGNCAEWCVRTHELLINNTTTYQHKLDGIGCAKNPIDNQSPGNWKPDRAGWCPGMVVPVRFNNIQKSLFGTNFNFEYKFEPWTREDKKDNNAYYAISNFVVLKSNSPIEKATISN